MTEQHVAAYREEAIELLTELEASLLDLEETPDDHDLINRVFRAMHAIRGSGVMFGFDAIAAFAHEVETAFDLVRNGKMKVTEDLLNLTLQSRDHISSLLDASSGLGKVDSSAGDAIITSLHLLAKPAEEVENQAAISSPPTKVVKSKKVMMQTWRIRFEPNRDLLMCGSNPLFLLSELRDLGTCEITAHFNNVPTLDILVAEHCYLYWDIVLTTSRGKEAILDVFISVEDNCRITIKLIDDSGKAEGNRCKLGEILIDRGDLSVDQLQAGLQQQKPLGQLLVASGAVTQEKVQSALAEQQHVKNARHKRTAGRNHQ
ncbi:MAG: Hpt domain-containing protein [Proteobacteria bacterium]|nr:Hpt domain-containing protein [Pseudomonadota bacterium]